MKNIEKNIYQEAQYSRKHLMGFAIAILIISLIALGGGIALIIIGASSAEVGQIIWKCILGAVLTILALVFGTFSIIMLCTSFAMIKNKNGSVKDGNRAIGTINITKCDKCGEELADDATFCSKCGTSVEGTKTCQCGTVNKIDNEFCTGCGKKMD